MAGPVYDEKARTLKLCSLVRIYEDIWPWMSRLISMACVLQIAEVRMLCDKLAESLGAESDESGHPKNGSRCVPDEMAEIFRTLIVPSGRQPCAWMQEEFESAVNNYMQGHRHCWRATEVWVSRLSFYMEMALRSVKRLAIHHTLFTEMGYA